MADGQYISNDEAKQAVAAIESVYHVDGVFNAAKLSEDIDAVEGTIDSHVSSRYPVPVTGAAALKMVKGFCVYLLRARGYGRLAAVETPVIVISNAKAARDQLKSIANGMLRLGATSESTDERISKTFLAETDEPILKREQLKQY